MNPRADPSRRSAPCQLGRFPAIGGTLLNQVSLRIIPRWVDVRGVSDPSATVTVDEQAAVQVGENQIPTRQP